MLRAIFTALLFLATTLATTAQDRPSAILVLDASGSMWGQIEGVNKIVIAREVVGDLLGTLPEDQALGLVAFGVELTDVKNPPLCGAAPKSR